MRDRLERIVRHVGHGFSHLEHPFHLTYLGLVYVEGHSLYAFAAGGLFVVVLVMYVASLIGGGD